MTHPDKSALDTFHGSGFYDQYLYDPAYVATLVDLARAFRTHGTYVEMFGHTGVIAEAVVRAGVMNRAVVVELDTESIEKGRNRLRATDLHVTFVQQDLGMAGCPVPPGPHLVYIGADSHELLLRTEQLVGLGQTCAAITTPGGRVVFRLAPHRDHHDVPRYAGVEPPDRWIEGLPGGGRLTFRVDTHDPLRALSTYSFDFEGSGQRGTYRFTMRHWSLPEISAAFPAFTFSLYTLDGEPVPVWTADRYDQTLALVGERC
jgi:hypothetical protein